MKNFVGRFLQRLKPYDRARDLKIAAAAALAARFEIADSHPRIRRDTYADHGGSPIRFGHVIKEHLDGGYYSTADLRDDNALPPGRGTWPRGRYRRPPGVDAQPLFY